MKEMRPSLLMNVTYGYGIAKVQNWGHESKLEILVQKIKVKKLDFNLYFREIKSDYIPVCTTE